MSPPTKMPLRFAVLAALLWSNGLVAQSVPTVRLAKPDKELAEPFTQISSVRELSDGRVIVADAQDKTLRLFDLATGAGQPIGRVGAGPAEYAIPRRLFPLRGDTTVLADPGNSRYLLILPGGKPGPTFALEESRLAGVRTVRGIDAMGRLYLQARRATAPRPSGGDAGKEVIVRYDRARNRTDVLATLALPQGREEGSMTTSPGMLRLLTNRPLAAEDIAAVAPDGRLALVRARDYHVEWIAPDGARIAGPVIVYDPIRVTAAEKRALLDGQVVPGQIITRGPAGGGRSAVMPRSSGTSPGGARPLPPGFDEASMQWPAHKPPFLGSAASIAGDGSLWVLRTRVHDDSIPRYDVFDAKGQLVGRVEIPKRTRVVGFGRGTVYLARTDEDDLQYLQRYRL